MGLLNGGWKSTCSLLPHHLCLTCLLSTHPPSSPAYCQSRHMSPPSWSGQIYIYQGCHRDFTSPKGHFTGSASKAEGQGELLLLFEGKNDFLFFLITFIVSNEIFQVESKEHFLHFSLLKEVNYFSCLPVEQKSQCLHPWPDQLPANSTTGGPNWGFVSKTKKDGMKCWTRHFCSTQKSNKVVSFLSNLWPKT